MRCLGCGTCNVPARIGLCETCWYEGFDSPYPVGQRVRIVPEGE